MFQGCFTAIVTPMHVDGEIDFAAFEQLIEWQLESGIDGLVVLGTTGEAATISALERAQLISRALDVVNKRKPVIIGTGTSCTQTSLNLTQQARDLGADAALIVTPYYNKPTQSGMFEHYKTIAEAVSIPQILYNVPSRTACDLLPETVVRLSAIDNIKAIKDATGEIDRVKRIADHCDMQLLSGDDPSALAFIQAGGCGVVSVASNVVPGTLAAMTHAALANDRVLAETYDKQLCALYKALFIESNPIPSKWALARMGRIEAGIRLPLTWLSEQYEEIVGQALMIEDVICDV